MAAHVVHNSGNQEWYTPVWIIEAARQVLGEIDLDPASSATANRFVQARTYYDKTMNGLDQPWSGRVWLNPPYASRLITPFVNKLLTSFDTVPLAITLTNNATETKWGQALLSRATAVCFLHKRVAFYDERLNVAKSPLQGQMVCFFSTLNLWPHTFRTVFAPYGQVFITNP